MKRIVYLCALLAVITGSSIAQTTGGKTFTNPLLPSGADPWVIAKDGYYYYTNTSGNKLVLWKTKNITDLAHAVRKVIWMPPAGTSYSRELWAPELHYLNHKWYMYFAADDGNNNHHRLYVIENSAKDPLQSTWVFKGKLADKTDKWAIDASVFENEGKLYLIWAGWQGDANGEQDIYIAKLKKPYELGSERVKISSPTYPWERHGDLHDTINPPHVNVNEGPEMLKHANKLFLIYSASGCWTDYYALGMLTADKNSDLLNPASWKKTAEPVFKEAPQNSVYATGHNAFFKSPDGTQDWIIYHANSQPGLGCGNNRSPRAQQFTWRADGSPDFGIPLKTGEPITVPSGTN